MPTILCSAFEAGPAEYLWNPVMLKLATAHALEKLSCDGFLVVTCVSMVVIICQQDGVPTRPDCNQVVSSWCLARLLICICHSDTLVGCSKTADSKAAQPFLVNQMQLWVMLCLATNFQLIWPLLHLPIDCNSWMYICVLLYCRTPYNLWLRLVNMRSVVKY